MPSTLLPNSIDYSLDFSPPSTDESPIAYVTQPTPTIDQEATIIYCAVGVSGNADTGQGVVTLRVRRSSMDVEGNPILTGTQIGPDIVAQTPSGALDVEVVAPVVAIAVDSGNMASAYVVTAQYDGDFVALTNDATSVGLLAVGS